MIIWFCRVYRPPVAHTAAIYILSVFCNILLLEVYCSRDTYGMILIFTTLKRLIES